MQSALIYILIACIVIIVFVKYILPQRSNFTMAPIAGNVTTYATNMSAPGTRLGSYIQSTILNSPLYIWGGIGGQERLDNIFVGDSAVGDLDTTGTSPGVIRFPSNSIYAGGPGAGYVIGSTFVPAVGSNFLDAPNGYQLNSSTSIMLNGSTVFQINNQSPNNDIKILAGSLNTQGYVDGSPQVVRFGSLNGITVASGGSSSLVCDTSNHCIRKVQSNGKTTTFAGIGKSAGYVDGPGNIAKFNTPSSIAMDSFGNYYVADTGNNRIRKITSAGVVTTFAGSGGSGATDGPAMQATFSFPISITIDSSGNLYVCQHNVIRKITPGGIVSTLVGVSGVTGYVDGPASQAKFGDIGSIRWIYNNGNPCIIVADTQNMSIRIIR